MLEKRNFAWPVTTFPKYDYDMVQDWVKQYEELIQKKQIVIFGAGIRGTLFLKFLNELGYNNIIFVDNNPLKVGSTINGCPIVSFEEVRMYKSKIIVLISIENAAAVHLQLEQAGFVLGENFFYLESKLYENFANEFIDKRPISNLVFGDCGLTDVAKQDEDYRSLADLICSQLGADRTKALAVHAMGLRGFYHILHAHIYHVSRPNHVVMMANFDALTGQQHLLPRSQNAPLIRWISDLLQKQDSELEEYAEICKERFEKYTFDCFTSFKKNMDHISQDKNDRLVFRISYMYQLNYDIEPMLYLRKIIQLCKTNNIALLFFIPPVNSEYAEQLWGDEFKKRYSANVASLCQFIGKDAGILDFSDLAHREDFAQKNTVDEIVRFNIRYKIAQKIAQAVELGIDYD